MDERVSYEAQVGMPGGLPPDTDTAAVAGAVLAGLAFRYRGVEPRREAYLADSDDPGRQGLSGLGTVLCVPFVAFRGQDFSVVEIREDGTFGNGVLSSALAVDPRFLAASVLSVE